MDRNSLDVLRKTNNEVVVKKIDEIVVERNRGVGQKR